MTTKNVEISRFDAKSIGRAWDRVSVEEPLEIRIRFFENGMHRVIPLSVTMRTPGNDKELALGFLFGEGIISGGGDVLGADHAQTLSREGRGNVIVVDLSTETRLDPLKFQRHFYTTSSCGVCGKASIAAIQQKSMFENADDRGVKINAEKLRALPETLKAHQKQYQNTGGIHATGLFDLEGNLLCLREDVGRHNAMDKMVGKMTLEQKIPLTRCVAFLSGRISFELVQKAHMAGIKILCAIGAPSSLAIELAEETDMSLAGFVKDNQFNVYVNSHRIVPA